MCFSSRLLLRSHADSAAGTFKCSSLSLSTVQSQTNPVCLCLSVHGPSLSVVLKHSEMVLSLSVVLKHSDPVYCIFAVTASTTVIHFSVTAAWHMESSLTFTNNHLLEQRYQKPRMQPLPTSYILTCLPRL